MGTQCPRAYLVDTASSHAWARTTCPPYRLTLLLVTGDREVETATVAVRSRSAGDLGTRSLDEFVNGALDEVRSKARTPMLAG